MFTLRNRVCRFVVLFPGRTGSTLLVESLNCHPRVWAYGEPLVGLRGAGAASQFRWAESFLTPPLICRHAAIGFKTKLKDVLDPDGFAALLRRVRARVILLQRRNRIKLVVSWINSERLHAATGKWQLYRAEDRPPAFRADLADFRSRLAQVEREKFELEDFVRRAALPTLSIDYEDLQVERDVWVHKAFSFLGVRPQRSQPRALKVTGENLRDVLTNFEELRACYAGTEYGPMYDEVLV